jgi:threonine/homoserine/homoserine lactone efflux protein
LLAFAAATVVLLLIPGPAVLYIVNRSVADGRAVGLAAVAGLQVGDLVHVVAATAGLSAVLAASATAFNVMKWIGVAYLLVVGVRTLSTAISPVGDSPSTMTRHRAFRQGVLVNTLNPKTALFFLSVFPQFVDSSHGRPWLQSLVLGVVFVLLESIANSTYSLLASTLGGALLRGKALPFAQRYVTGSMFVGLGFLAAAAQGARRQTARTAACCLPPTPGRASRTAGSRSPSAPGPASKHARVAATGWAACSSRQPTSRRCPSPL